LTLVVQTRTISQRLFAPSALVFKDLKACLWFSAMRGKVEVIVGLFRFRAGEADGSYAARSHAKVCVNATSVVSHVSGLRTAIEEPPMA